LSKKIYCRIPAREYAKPFALRRNREWYWRFSKLKKEFRRASDENFRIYPLELRQYQYRLVRKLTSQIGLITPNLIRFSNFCKNPVRAVTVRLVLFVRHFFNHHPLKSSILSSSSKRRWQSSSRILRP